MASPMASLEKLASHAVGRHAQGDRRCPRAVSPPRPSASWAASSFCPDPRWRQHLPRRRRRRRRCRSPKTPARP
eukprot:8815495-Pyramimonas_sp.AAC.1